MIPPQEPILYTDGQQLKNQILGPLREGQVLRISCKVSEGEPPPRVVWLKDGEVSFLCL